MLFLPKRLFLYLLFSLVIFTASYLFSSWFREIISKDIKIAAVFLLTTFTAYLYLYNNTVKTLILFLSIFAILVFFQVRTTNIKNGYSVNASQKDLQIQRMNYYPPRLARLGFILENKSEVKTIQKIEKNFFDVIDFKGYFPDYFSFAAFPFFVIGLLTFAEHKNRTIVYLLAFCIIVLTVIGVHGKFGPFIVFPFIMLSIFIPLFKMLGLDRKYEI